MRERSARKVAAFARMRERSARILANAATSDLASHPAATPTRPRHKGSDMITLRVVTAACLGVCVGFLAAVRAGDDESPPNPAPKRAGQDWWSLQQLTRPDLPPVKNQDWVRNPIDAFVLATLEAQHLQPAAPADRATLIRRVTFDLLGLPPTPAEIDAFLNDESPDAYEKVVDRLLASPHYGERWARHWLDVARFAESQGFEYDTHPRPRLALPRLRRPQPSTTTNRIPHSSRSRSPATCWNR